MKITYLDQNHWINLSQAAYGRHNDPEMARVLDALDQACATGHVYLPLSFGHYVETRKQRDTDQRYRLAKCMLAWSGSITVAPPSVVMRHEIDVALGRCFPGRVVAEPLQLLGFGMAHACANPGIHRPMHWPPGAEALPAPMRAAYKARCREKVEIVHLSGILQGQKLREWGPLTDLRWERWFKDSLVSWRGVQSQYTPEALDRDIDIMHLTDLDSMLQDALARHGITREEFAQLGESRQRGLLEEMPWQRADKRDSKGRFARAKRKIKRYFIYFLVIGTLCAAYHVRQMQLFLEYKSATPIVEALTGDSSEAVEVLAERLLTEKLETLQYEIVDSLAANCETKGKKEPDAVIIFDSNEEPSIGAWQYQRDTVVRYYKKFYGQTITRTEAIQIAIDHDKARELTREILFEEKGEYLGGGYGNWTNCSRKLGLPEQIDLLNRLAN